MEYHLRIRCKELTDQQVINFIDKISIKHIIALEQDESGHHYHSYFQTTLKDGKLRKDINKDLNIKGNEEFSLSKKRTENLSVYVCKEKVIHTKNFSEEDIKILQDKSYKKKEKAKAFKKIEDIEHYLNKQITAEDVDILENQVLGTNFQGVVKRIMKLMIDYHIDNNFCFNKIQLDRYVTTYLCRKSNTCKGMLVDKLYRDIFQGF